MDPIFLFILIIMTLTLISSMLFSMFLLIMHLRIKSEIPETLKLEIEKNRDIYEFIKRRRFVKPENIVIDFQRIHPRSPKYGKALATCTKELNERSTGKYNTLTKIGNVFELSENSRKFFIYESPTAKQLIRYIFKHEIDTKDSFKK